MFKFDDFYENVKIGGLFLALYKYGAVGGKGSLESWLINFPTMFSPPKLIEDEIKISKHSCQKFGCSLIKNMCIGHPLSTSTG